MDRIDVHHHFIPPQYIEAYDATGGDPSGWKLPAWNVQHTLQLMDAHNTQTAILSLTAPGTSILVGSASAILARQVNEYAAQLCKQHPGRLGFFASLPPLSAENLPAALSEMAYALDTLHADGVTLYTRYGGYEYLGHDDFAPLWAELDRRAAVVFIHPTHTVDTNLVNPTLPQPIIDYPHETGRTAVDLITSGTIRRNPNVKIILSHAGGTLPYLATRAAHLLADTGLSHISPEEFLDAARSFYFDLALSGNPWSLGLLMKFARPEHVLYGSDFPYAPRETVNKNVGMLEEFLSEEEVMEYSVARGAAVALFPRFAMDSDVERRPEANVNVRLGRLYRL